MDVWFLGFCKKIHPLTWKPGRKSLDLIEIGDRAEYYLKEVRR